MSENFLKIKKKYMTVAIVASCILGACVGVALACTLAVVFKTCGVNVHWAVYIPVAIVLAAGAGYPFFLILRPNDKRIAKKLDRDFSLNQKVQTMVEFATAEGEIPALQREQTNEALGAVARKRVDLKWLLKFAFVPVIAAAMLLAGIFVPAKKTTEYVDPAFDMTNSQEIQLESLIEEVENKSSLEIGLKTFIGLELRGLLDMVKDAEVQSEMKGALVEAVKNIDGFVIAANSYLEIDSAFKFDETLKAFSTAAVNGVVSYKTGATATDLTSMGRVNDRKGKAEGKIENALLSWKNTFLADYAADGTPIAAADAAEKLKPFADALKTGLAAEELAVYAPQSEEERLAVRAAAEGDEYYNCLTALSANLSKHADAYGNYDDNGYYENLDGYFTAFAADAGKALAVQSYNCMMDEYIRNALSKIFGVKFSAPTNVAPAPTETESSGNNGNKEESSGGYGDGKHEYGSNDEILDVDTGEKHKYSDPISPDDEEYTYYVKYYNKAMELINSDSCPGDIAAYIKQYFGKLENGLDEN